MTSSTRNSRQPAADTWLRWLVGLISRGLAAVCLLVLVGTIAVAVLFG